MASGTPSSSRNSQQCHNHNHRETIFVRGHIRTCSSLDHFLDTYLISPEMCRLHVPVATWKTSSLSVLHINYGPLKRLYSNSKSSTRTDIANSFLNASRESGSYNSSKTKPRPHSLTSANTMLLLIPKPNRAL
jgi:hypothetical protein